ncbi:DNA mismatch repair protein [Pseudoflavitalea sp. X16]|uniref:MutS-related protein n=1 Tax=Paraflavitalea devenefica TaxID=2716334 RepID=UPI0014247DB7|nr:DNA mismatch repair protein [Paraflavitalea devenefica]NII26259.1 DNA mismatch repair protein [Paraflavitalea devenefica]
MSFSIDAQTLEELNLLGKFRQGSVYSLFNQVKTRGGEQLLDSMFRTPLDNAAAINERSSTLQFFQQAQLVFPFDAQEISAMREYLDAGTGNNVLVTLSGTVIKKVLAGLTRDERYRKMIQGLQATIVTLSKCYALLEMIQFPAGAYRTRIEAVRKLLSDKQLEKLRNIDIYTALPVKDIAFYEHILKGKLQEDMERILSFIYELDVYIAVSDVAGARGFMYAQAFPPEKNILQARGLYHPGIKNAVGNDLSLHQQRNVMFLTGANMAGKSTWMKSVGIALYLAHMGFPVAAASMDFSVREGLYSSINVADNISLGYSHFYAEVIRVKQAAEATSSGKRLLLMFDELFKGTNVKDAYDGTLAVTEAFAEYRECLFIVSTHIIEVGEVLKGHSNIHCVYMPTVMEGAHPRYTYKLQEGITEDRQGMMIIRNEGILELIGE